MIRLVRLISEGVIKTEIRYLTLFLCHIINLICSLLRKKAIYAAARNFWDVRLSVSESDILILIKKSEISLDEGARKSDDRDS